MYIFSGQFQLPVSALTLAVLKLNKSFWGSKIYPSVLIRDGIDEIIDENSSSSNYEDRGVFGGNLGVEVGGT